jgi:Uri superfamily endonuclease
MRKYGAYILHLDVPQPLTLKAGAFKGAAIPSGRYVYIGSARSGIEARIARHKRLAEQKAGKLHWHIDYLLTHPQTRLTAYTELPGASECDVSRHIASRRGVSAPVPNFGSTDCRSGCKAHLYHVGSDRKGFFRMASGRAINNSQTATKIRKEN